MTVEPWKVLLADLTHTFVYLPWLDEFSCNILKNEESRYQCCSHSVLFCACDQLQPYSFVWVCLKLAF